MALLPGGILGGPNGTVGAVVTYQLNGQNVMRGKPRRSTKPPTLPQLQSRMEMGVLTLFIDKVKGFVKTGFSPLAMGTTRNYHNLAIGYNRSQGTTGNYPDIQIDFEHLMLSKGDLDMAANPMVQRVENGLKFTWDYPGSPVEGYGKDQVMMLAYSPRLNKSTFIDSGARREKKEDVLILLPAMLQEQLEVYISFVSNDRLNAADSLYLGTVGPEEEMG
ncbi:hypothetical protein IWX76_001191 [Pedobacter sp. CAN_A7]|uniref:DUF6266 family protein n=1 Tax=Pedobacter sp. CAN_A7 TaxID=2787722 RepID=UPI0018C9C607